MKIRFWGVRGSFPVASPDVIRYGGNTPCVEVETAAASIVVDAGTGIRDFGKTVVERGTRHVDLLLSHAHWDHVQGFPHFEPLFNPDFSLTVHALRHPSHPLEEIFTGQQQDPFYPVPLSDMPATVTFVEREDGDRFQLGDAEVLTRRLNHPGVAGGFRVEAGGKSFAYICDTDLTSDHLMAVELPTEPALDDSEWLEAMRQGARDLGHCANLMVCDTFFEPDDYDPTWGHSRTDHVLEFAEQQQAGKVCLFHHRPGRSDDDIDQLVETYRASCAVPVIAAQEGLNIDL